VRITAIILLIGVVIAVALGLCFAPQRAAPAQTTTPQTMPTQALPNEAPLPVSVRESMVFRREGDCAGIVAEVERVVGVGRCLAARITRKDATWICILVDDVGPWMGPEPNWPRSLFPELETFKFEEPPPPVMRTLSIYRSVVKQSLKWTERDRLLVLVLPKDRWDQLRLRWPGVEGSNTLQR